MRFISFRLVATLGAALLLFVPTGSAKQLP